MSNSNKAIRVGDNSPERRTKPPLGTADQSGVVDLHAVTSRLRQKTCTRPLPRDSLSTAVHIAPSPCWSRRVAGRRLGTLANASTIRDFAPAKLCPLPNARVFAAADGRVAVVIVDFEATVNCVRL